MKSRISLDFARISAMSLLIILTGTFVFGQRASTRDENYDSPTPVLLSDINTKRAVAQTGRISRKFDPSKIVAQAYQPDARITLYVGDLALMAGEGANALRVYAEDKRGYIYRFPVLDLQRIDGAANVHAMTVLLKDEVGYYEPPTADGDLLIYVTWRGLASNKALLGLGKMGGEIKVAQSSTAAPEAVTGSRSQDRQRFMEQAGFGPTPTLAEIPAGTPLRRWIAAQFATPYPTFPYPAQPLKPNQGNDPLCDGGADDVPVTCVRDTYTMYPIQKWNSQEMLYGDNQLRHRVSWALSQIWVNSGVDIQQSRHMVEWHKIISNNAFGNYRTLMKEMTLSPTMGDYLSMSQSTRTNPNENYAREIKQLFTIGLFMLNPDGTFICVENNPCQPGDTKVPTYDQNVVNNLTEVFTGWSFCSISASCPNIVGGTVNFIDPMLLNGGVTTAGSNRHDLTAKTLLTYPGSTTTNIAACPTSGAMNCTATGGTTNAQALANIATYANASMDQALDNIFYHPNVGPYIGKILIQQMITSDPTPAYVGRVAAAFNNNGLGVRGDMKSVISAILLDPEARGNVKTDPNYGKLREPVQFATNILRAFNVRDAAGIGQSDGVFFQIGEFTGMGQIPFRSPTVFNYYPPDFVIPGTAVLGPEFALMTTGTTISRTNFVNRMVFTAPAISVTADRPLGTSLDFSDLQNLYLADTSGSSMVDELNSRLMHGTMSSTMRTTILNSLAPISSTDSLAKVRQAVYLVATSSQYQVQR